MKNLLFYALTVIFAVPAGTIFAEEDWEQRVTREKPLLCEIRVIEFSGVSEFEVIETTEGAVKMIKDSFRLSEDYPANISDEKLRMMLHLEYADKQKIWLPGFGEIVFRNLYDDNGLNLDLHLKLSVPVETNTSVKSSISIEGRKWIIFDPGSIVGEKRLGYVIKFFTPKKS